jgi:hypothetical protein
MARAEHYAVFCAFVGMLVGCGSDAKKADEEVDASAQAATTCEKGKPCVDAFGAPICPVVSGYEGDDLAMCEPASVEEGLLLHYGPKDYDDPKEVEKYLLPAYGEDENCVYVRTTNDEPVYINRYHGRMRPYSHHLIVTILADPPADLEFGVPTSCNQGEAIGSRWLLGSQDPQIDLEIEGASPGSEPAVEGDPEYGLGQVIQPNTVLRIDMHYVNTTDKELLREGWVYLKTVPKEDVVTRGDMLTFFQGNIQIPPNSKGVQTAVARCRAPSDRYVAMMTGHFHQNGTRFSVWHEKADGKQTLVYETSDWDIPGNAIYSKRIQNPAIGDGGIWGASSGYLMVKQGEYLNFQCEYDNPTDQTVTLGELGKDQMCNVFGFYYPTDGDVWNCICVGPACI